MRNDICTAAVERFRAEAKEEIRSRFYRLRYNIWFSFKLAGWC